MHLELEQFNRLLEDRATTAECAAWTDHILDCKACAQRYKFLAAFQASWQAAFAAEAQDQVIEMKPSASRLRRVGTWLAAAAAIVVFAVATWPSQPSTTETTDVAQHLAAPDFQTGQVLAMVADINFKSAVQAWGQETTALDLVQIKNKP